MRDREQHYRNAAAAQIRQNGLRALAKGKRRVIHARALDEAADEQHHDHQSNAISGRPEMQLDQRRVTPFAADQSRHDVIHRSKHDHREKRVETEMRIGNARFGEVHISRHRSGVKSAHRPC